MHISNFSRGRTKRYIAAADRAEVQRAIDQAIAARSLFELEHRFG